MKIRSVSRGLLALAFLMASTVSRGAGGDSRIHVAKGGATFTLDTSNPLLSPAYRDQAGRVWGSGPLAPVASQFAAVDVCESLGARLPTVSDFGDLAKLLGQNSGAGYSAFGDDVVTPVLPNLISGGFWAADRDWTGGGSMFEADRGLIGVTSSSNVNQVICISKSSEQPSFIN